MITLTTPVVPAPTVAVIWVAVFVKIPATAVPPIRTLAAVAPVRFVPLIVIVDPGHPLVGDIEVIVGETITGGVHLKILPEDGKLVVDHVTVLVFAVPAEFPAQFALEPVRLLKSPANVDPLKPI